MTTDVIVVGAGPTGLMTACELARRGVAVTVLDGADGPFRGSRGKGLQPRSLELLDRLGLAGRLVSQGRFGLPVRRWTTGTDGEPVARDHDPHPGVVPTPASPYARTLIVPQWRTEQVLREHLAELGVEVRWGVRVTGVTQDDERATVATTAGPLTARWVVGCDGGSSAVRRSLGVSFLGETHEDVRMLIGDVVVEGVDRDHWHMWEPFLGLCPLPATDTFVLQAGGADPSGPLTVATFQDVLDRGGAGHVRVRDVRWSSRWRLNVRMVDRYRVGRVLLAGDAAHVHSPAGGQGLNTGVGDAANLGWKLAAVLAGADDRLLDTYEAERLSVAADVLGLSSQLSGRRFEDRGAEGTRALQLGVTYRGGPLAAGPPSGDGPQAGDRAPDAPLGDADGRRVRLFDLFRHPGWTLLVFGEASAPDPAGTRTVAVRPALDTVPAAPAPVTAAPAEADPASAATTAGADPVTATPDSADPVTATPGGADPVASGPVHPAADSADPVADGVTTVWDHAGHAARVYAPCADELVLIRPDGHIALRTTDPAEARSFPAPIGAAPVPAPSPASAVASAG